MTEEKILGFTLQNWVEMLDTSEAKKANKALKYYDGKQEEEMTKLLDDPDRGRKNWKQRGIIPRFRNLTQMIVEKSGKLFKDVPPTLSVYEGKNVNELTSNLLQEELDKAGWIEFFTNHDAVLRLLKTAVVLTQFDPEDNSLSFETLHRGNCVIITDSFGKKVLGLVYKTSEFGKVETYRIITQDEYIDLVEIETETTEIVSISNRIPNPYGIVPITFFNDTRLPRVGIWNEPGMDLIAINELYNLHLTDAEYAISWSKFPNLIMIDCEVSDSENLQMQEILYTGDKMPRTTFTPGEISAGPSKAIMLRSNGSNSAQVDYKTPEVSIEPLDLVVQNWVNQFSYDWSVRLNTAGNGSATSGFQLVVEELPNLELRQQRAKMMSTSLNNLFKVIKVVINTHYGRKVFSDTSTLYVEFNNPNLPVDGKQTEEIWDLKITGNRASVVDYLERIEGYSKDEAIKKYEEILTINSKNKAEA